MATAKQLEFQEDIAKVINRHSVDTELGMADFVLAELVTRTLATVRMANAENKRLGYDKLGKD